MNAAAYPILDIPFSSISYDDVVARIEGWRQTNQTGYVAVANPHTVLLCARSPHIREAVTGASLILPDGIGIIFAAILLGHATGGRVSGPTLMLRAFDVGRQFGWRHFLLGGTRQSLDKLASNLMLRFPGVSIVGFHPPPFRPETPDEEAQTIRRINESGAHILWVGLGAPKQELWIFRNRYKLSVTASIGVGAAFDFHSGQVPWAPTWMRALGLEWLHRLAHDPRRMWKRNLDSPIFLVKVFRQRLAMFARWT